MEKVYCILLQFEDGGNLTYEIFKLKYGNYLIGSDDNCDIVLKISKEIDFVHAKIIIDDFEDIGIESMSEKGQMFKQKNGHKIVMKKRREYEFSAGKEFYLTEHIKISLIEGTISEIKQQIQPGQIEYLDSYFKSEERPELYNLFYDYEERKENSFKDEQESNDETENKGDRLSLVCDEVISIKTKRSLDIDKSRSYKSLGNSIQEREPLAYNINKILFTRNYDDNKFSDKGLSLSQPSPRLSYPKSAPVSRQANTSLSLEISKPKSNNGTNLKDFPNKDESLSLEFESVDDQNIVNENFDIEIPNEIKNLSSRMNFQEDEEVSLLKGKVLNSEDSIYSNIAIPVTDDKPVDVSFVKSKSNISSKIEAHDEKVTNTIIEKNDCLSSPTKKRVNKILNKKILQKRVHLHRIKEETLLEEIKPQTKKQNTQEIKSQTAQLLNKKRNRKEAEEDTKKSKLSNMSYDSISEDNLHSTPRNKKQTTIQSDNVPLEPILKIAISGGIIIDRSTDKAIKALNYKIVNDNDYDFDILITDKLTHKDIQMLLAINKRIPILSSKWLEDSVKTKEIVPYEKKYYLKDKEGERKYNISIEKNNQLEQPAEYCEGYSFYVSDHLSSPSSEEIEELIESAGGLIVDNYSKVKNKKNLILILDKANDKDMIKTIKSKNLYNIHNADLIINSVFSQGLDLSTLKYKI